MIGEFYRNLHATAQSPASKLFHDHLFACGYCNGRTGRYCDEGRALHAAYHVPAVAESIMGRRSLDERRRVLAAQPEHLRPLIEAEVKRLWAERQAAKQRDR